MPTSGSNACSRRPRSPSYSPCRPPGCARRPAPDVSPTFASVATAATSAPRSTPGSRSSEEVRRSRRGGWTSRGKRAWNEAVSARNDCESGKWGRVWRYEGTRGVVWRIRYRDATGRRVLETLGREPAWNRKRAEQELRRRLVDVERDGYRAPAKTTFAAFAERWLMDYLPGRGLKLTTQDSYRQTIRNHLLPHFGRHELARLEQQPELIDRYITHKIRSGLSSKTVTNHLLCLQD